MNFSIRLLMKAFALAGVFCLLIQPASAATTGLTFAGGCPEDGTPFCAAMGDNATEEKVAELLGLAEADVTEVLSGFGVGAGDIGQTSGTWFVTDSSITHLAFKSNGYFILGSVDAVGGFWMNDTSVAGSWDISEVDCLASICGAARPYVDDDFTNNGGQVAALSNVRAFTAVPVPASVWLFGSALGLLGWIRRRAT